MMKLYKILNRSQKILILVYLECSWPSIELAGVGCHYLKNSMHDGSCEHYLILVFWAIFKNVQNDPEIERPFVNEQPKNTNIYQ